MIKRITNHPDFMPTLASIGVIFLVVLFYFHPLIQGKKLKSTDIILVTGQQQNVNEYRERHPGDDALWSMSMFSGMPAYTIHIDYKGNILLPIRRAINKMLPEPTGLMIIGMLSFWGLLRVFGVNIWLSVAGGIAFGLFSYHIIITEAGHGAKFAALMFCPGVLAGMAMAFRGKLLWGSLLFILMLGFELQTGHVQITYYLIFIVLLYGLYELIRIIQEKTLVKNFALPTILLSAGAALALGLNTVNLFPLKEYNDYSIRGTSELKVEPADRGKQNVKASPKTKGVDKDYAYAWSNGRDEVYTLLIPNLKGGSSNGRLGKGTETYEYLTQQGMSSQEAAQYQWPLYWGTQSFTSGPTYAGAIICFLFVVGLILAQTGVKWALLYATLLFIFLSMGKNSYSVAQVAIVFGLPLVFYLVKTKVKPKMSDPLLGTVLAFVGLTVLSLDIEGYRFKDLFFDNLPLYSKFRAPASMLSMVAVTMPWMALLGAQALLNNKIDKEEKLQALYFGAGITVAIALFFAFLASSFLDYNFSTEQDATYKKQLGALMDKIIADREALMRKDALRSVGFILVAAGLLWAYIKGHLKSAAVVSIALVALVTIDLFVVDSRYLWTSDYQSESYQANHEPREADTYLKEKNKGKYFRVFPMNRNPFNDGMTPYHLFSIGGYNAAKIKRYQQLIEAQISKANFEVLNMLNTEYIIHEQRFSDPHLEPIHETQDKEVIYRNRTNLGPAWIVQNVKVVPTPDDALYGLDSLKTAENAIIEAKHQALLTNYSKDSIDYKNEKITLLSFDNKLMAYEYNSPKNRFVVFSEVFYEKGWKAFIDGKETPILHTNFVLRGLVVPAGKHKIEFKYNPEIIEKSSNISRMASIAFILLFVGLIGFEAFRLSRSNTKS